MPIYHIYSGCNTAFYRRADNILARAEVVKVKDRGGGMFAQSATGRDEK